MPSTMMSRPGRPSTGRGTSGAMNDGPNIEAEAECPFGAVSWRLERPSVHNWRNQRDMAVAAFEGGRIEVRATVPHQSVREPARGGDLLHNRLVGCSKQGRPGLDTGILLPHGQHR